MKAIRIHNHGGPEADIENPTAVSVRIEVQGESSVPLDTTSV